jgi:hypothetical protein
VRKPEKESWIIVNNEVLKAFDVQRKSGGGIDGKIDDEKKQSDDRIIYSISLARGLSLESD